MLEQIKQDACYLFQEDRHDKDGVKYAMAMYGLMTVLIALIIGVYGLIALVVIEYVRASGNKKASTTKSAGLSTLLNLFKKWRSNRYE
ncbi:hypothetical protein AB9M75_12500 [Lactobacillus sp. AN1001]